MPKSKSQRTTIDGYTFSQGELEWAREHLDDLRRSARGYTPLLFVMAITFVLGLAIYFAADAISTGALPLPPEWRADLVADFLHNLGVVLWTSVVLAFLLEIVVEYQRHRWQRYIQLVERVTPASATTEVSTDDGGEVDVAATLELVLKKLQALDTLRTELAEVKTQLTAALTAKS